MSPTDGPSNGPNITQCLQQNARILSDSSGIVPKENVALYNISVALLGMYEDIDAEFERLNVRLTNLEQQLRR
jgi:hypothetical protein